MIQKELLNAKRAMNNNAEKTEMLLIDFGRLKKDFLIPYEPGLAPQNHLMVNIGSSIIAMIEDYAIGSDYLSTMSQSDSGFFEAFIHYVELCQSMYNADDVKTNKRKRGNDK